MVHLMQFLLTFATFNFVSVYNNFMVEDVIVTAGGSPDFLPETHKLTLISNG